MKINRQQFEMRQPEHRNEDANEDYFYNLSNKILNKIVDAELLKEWPEQIVVRAAIGIVGYFQDILADTGIFRSFVNMHRHLYNKTLPFYPEDDNYIDYEINYNDVRFLLWYTLSMNSEDMRDHDPFDKEIKRAADICYDILEAEYDEAPIPESFNMIKGLELNIPEEREQIYRFGSWLFMYSYLMSPAYAQTMFQMISEPEMQSGDVVAIQDRIERSMVEDPTGPLALYLGEWLNLILDNKYPEHTSETKTNGSISKYYEPFMEATGGSPIAFFKDYNSLNNFFIDALHWDANEQHLPQFKNHTDFVLLISKYKGVLLAKDIAKVINHPENKLYDKAYAESHAMDLLTVRGLCPVDLLNFLKDGNYITDAHFKNNPDTNLVIENFDFIARCYLQLYYRGD